MHPNLFPALDMYFGAPVQHGRVSRICLPGWSPMHGFLGGQHDGHLCGLNRGNARRPRTLVVRCAFRLAQCSSTCHPRANFSFATPCRSVVPRVVRRATLASARFASRWWRTIAISPVLMSPEIHNERLCRTKGKLKITRECADRGCCRGGAFRPAHSLTPCTCAGLHTAPSGGSLTLPSLLHSEQRLRVHALKVGHRV